jgi:hypothetical protein
MKPLAVCLAVPVLVLLFVLGLPHALYRALTGGYRYPAGVERGPADARILG